MDNMEENIVLDGEEISKEKFDEQTKRKDIRVVPVDESSKTFKTLKRLQE